jgi:hypothetical protein
MANTWYPKFKEALLKDTVGLDITNAGVAVKAVMVDGADYTYSAAHEFLSDVPSGARVSTTAALTGKTATNGLFDAADSVFTAVTGDPTEILIVYIDTGVEGTSRLMLFLDTGVTITPSGIDLTLTWNVSGIAQL